MIKILSLLKYQLQIELWIYSIIGLNVDDYQLVFIREKETAAQILGALGSANERDALKNQISIYERIALLKIDERTKVTNHINQLMEQFQKLQDLGAETSD